MNFSQQKFNFDLLNEMMPLLEKHYKEIAIYQDIPLSIKKETYLTLSKSNFLRVFTVRDNLNNIIGYSVYIVSHNIHYSTLLEAKNDVIYIDPKHRGFGAKFIKWCDQQLKKENVQVVYHHIKFDHDWSNILERQDYKPFEKIYAKRLDMEE